MPAGRFGLYNRDTGHALATVLEPAFTSETRRRGLLGRDEMEPNSALLIAPCSAIHTFFMRFPIDVAFADRRGRVLKTYSALPAWRMAFALNAFVAIELPSGALARSGTTRGASLAIVAL